MVKWKKFAIFGLIYTCVALPWLTSGFYTWHMGLYRCYHIAQCMAITCAMFLIGALLIIPGSYIYKGRKYPEFHQMWLSSFYERCPRWVKKIVDRSCAKDPDNIPALELLRIAKNIRKVGLVFTTIGLAFAVLTFYLLETYKEELSTIYSIIVMS